MVIPDDWKKLVKAYETRNQYQDLWAIAEEDFSKLADALMGPIWEATADGRNWDGDEAYHVGCEFCRNMAAESIKIILHRIGGI